MYLEASLIISSDIYISEILVLSDIFCILDDQNKTMVVIPCILDNEAKVKEMFKKIEVYYLANEDKNIFFTLLGFV